MAERPSLWNFARAIWSHWGERMSGPASVPLMLMALFIPNQALAIATGLVGIACGLLAAYRVWAVERNRVIELEKIDRQDLEHMLNGLYLGDTFMYGGEWMLCMQYSDKFELDRIKNRFDMIQVPAPKNSFVTLRFQYLNGHDGVGNHAFYILDGNGQEKLIDIYRPPEIYLDGQWRFGLKLVCDAAYQIDDAASLWVGVKTWTK